MSPAFRVLIMGRTKGGKMRHQVIGMELGEIYQAPVVQGKGGFFVKGHGFITLRKARELTGHPAPAKVKRERVMPWGDYATIAALNGVKLKQELAPCPPCLDAWTTGYCGDEKGPGHTADDCKWRYCKKRGK